MHLLLVTNDDGVESPGLKALVEALHSAGHPLLVCAPETEQSASSMRLTLHRGLTVKRRDDVRDSLNLSVDGPAIEVYSVNGSPCDCVLTALSGGLPEGVGVPAMCVSGANQGPNLSIDVLHSGTVGAARQAAMDGLPAMAVSLNSYTEDDYSGTAASAAAVVEALGKFLPKHPDNLMRPNGSNAKSDFSDPEVGLRDAWLKGDIYLNLNVPVDWAGGFHSTRLGARWYRGAVSCAGGTDDEWPIRIGAASIEDDEVDSGDANMLMYGVASLGTLPTWPQGHPLSVPDQVLLSTFGFEGLPDWIATS